MLRWQRRSSRCNQTKLFAPLRIQGCAGEAKEDSNACESCLITAFVARPATVTASWHEEQNDALKRVIFHARHSDLIVMGRKGHHRLERALLGCVTARVIGHTERDVLVVPKDASIDFGRILLAAEGAGCSNKATERAIDYAKSYGAELEAVAVVDVTDEFHTYAPAAVEKFVLKFREVLEALKAKAEAVGVKTRTFIKEGEAFEVIRDLAEDEKADLIVLGSHGRKGLSKVLMGSVTEKVVRMSPCPVLSLHGYKVKKAGRAKAKARKKS